MAFSPRLKGLFLSALVLAVFVGAWHLATLPKAATQSADSEYAKLVGAQAASGQKSAFPAPADFGAKLLEHLKNPFYDKGANDKGIGVQLAYSIGRVLLGFLLAALAAIPVGFLIGMSPLAYRALDPSITTTPPEAVSSPARILRMVVLPQPEWPMMATNSPLSMAKLRSSKMTAEPKRLVSPWICRKLIRRT
jgi:ABC-type nitrate/sulfonate/bicarbonate transport system permease component